MMDNHPVPEWYSHEEYTALENNAETLREKISRQQAEIELLQAHAIECQDLALEHYGSLLTIRSWLSGKLPEATAEQFIKLCGQAKQPSHVITRRAALESEANDE